MGLGPAGTGKTTAMRALKAVLDHTRSGRLIPLATSAHAAGILGAELGVRAENVHKFLHDHTTKSPGRIEVAAGDVVLVDEAGMAGTPNLDRILALAQRAGARVRLLGDDRQLAAVESGGALRLLVGEAGRWNSTSSTASPTPTRPPRRWGCGPGTTGRWPSTRTTSASTAAPSRR